MMSDANREIRMLEARAALRRRQPTPQGVLHRLDFLIGELEEMNLTEAREVPEAFIAEFDELRRLLPGGRFPRTWPRSVNSLLDCCFDLQGQVLSPHTYC
jgi:hypothetical protein